MGRRSKMPLCVICGVYMEGEGRMTCSPLHNEIFVQRMEQQFGEFKKCVRMTTGEAFKVPTRDIIEKGIREQELDQYPRWEDAVP